MSEPTFDRPFPALTPAQRYYLDVYGYVVVPDVLTPDECGRILQELQQLKRDLQAQEEPQARVRGSYFLINEPHHTFMASILEAGPAVTAYAIHPRLVAMGEELIGGEARIVECNAHINSRNPNETFEAEPKFGFHNGMDIPFGTHTENGLYHCSFLKTLTNLTDLGPDDGGTLSPEFAASIPEELQTLFHGKAHWTRAPRYRTLADPADAREFRLGNGLER